MIQSFANQGTADLFNSKNTKAARKLIPPALRKTAHRRLFALDYVESLQELRNVPTYGLHRLHRDRKGQWAIRIDDQYRVCFKWTPAGPAEVEVTDYH